MVKIDSLWIDLTEAANEVDPGECTHKTLRQVVAEMRETAPERCWPFPEESLAVLGQETFSHPLTVPRSRYWDCDNCVKEISGAMTQDAGPESNRLTLGERNIDDNSTDVQPSRSKAVADLLKQSKTNVTDNPIEANGNVNSERAENQNVNSERAEKDDHLTVSKLRKRVQPRATTEAPPVKSKSEKLAVPRQGRNTRSKSKEKEKVDQAVTTSKSSDIAVVVEPKATRSKKRKVVASDEPESGKVNREKVRLLSDLSSRDNIRTRGGSQSNFTKGESSKAKKRKLTRESTDSENDRVPIKGKTKNRRFQVPEESSQEGKKEGKKKKVNLAKSRNGIFINEGAQRPTRQYNQPMVTWPVQPNGWSTSGVAEPRSNNNNKTAEVVEPSPVLQKDASVLDRKGKRVMVEEEEDPCTSGSESSGGTADIPEEENDDIPMEIVELMARNQYERGLPDKEEVVTKQPPQETVSKPKTGLLIDLNEVYDEEYNVNTSRQPTPRGNDVHIPTAIPQKPVEFFPVRNSHLPPSPLGTRQWLENVPTMPTNQTPYPSTYGELRNTWQSIIPHQYQAPHHPHHYQEAAHRPPVWSSAMTPPQYQYQQVYWSPDPNAAAGLSHSGRSGDTFSRERYMDPRMTSTAPINPYVNAEYTERRFQPVNQYSNIQRGESSRQQPFDIYNRRFSLPEPSRTSFPTGPPFGRSPFSFQTDQPSWSQHEGMVNRRQDIMGPPGYSHRENMPMFGSGGSNQGTSQLPGPSTSRRRPLRLQEPEEEIWLLRKVKASRNNSAGVVIKEVSEPPMVCSLNRNPADFTVPEAGNIFMISGESLKVDEPAAAASRKKPRLSKKDASKKNKKPGGSNT